MLGFMIAIHAVVVLFSNHEDIEAGNIAKHLTKMRDLLRFWKTLSFLKLVL